ncbi:MAG: hypothetical protein DPW16_11400 [Chloroflexi bacterium]|nr:hypothetical protein [Chloroflexota bacterium]
MLELGIIRIISSEYDVLGSGFLIDNRYAFTCAHAIESEITDKDNITNNIIYVNFPLINEEIYPARIRYYNPAKEKRGRNDVALLQLEDAPKQIREVKSSQLLYLVPYRRGELSARAYGFPEDSVDGRWVDVNLKGPVGERLQFSSNDAIKVGFSGAALIDSKHENMVIGMIASKISSPETGFAIPADYLQDILKEIQHKDCILEAIRILDSEKAKYERELTMEFEDFVRGVFDKAHNRTQYSNGHTYMRQREILVYGWLLQKRYGAIIRQQLYKYVGENQKDQIDRFLYRDLPKQGIEEDEDEYLRFSKDFMLTIETIGLSDPPIMKPVPYLEITGYDILKYFMEMESRPNLDMVITQAFTSALNAQLGNIQKVRNLTFSEIVDKNQKWKFIVVVDTNDGVYTVNDLRSIAADSVLVRAGETTPILLFAPNSEDITFLGESEYFYKIYHIWSISIARLFSRLDILIKAKQKQKVTEYFNHFFPPEDESSDFKAGDWISRLEQAIP